MRSCKKLHVDMKLCWVERTILEVSELDFLNIKSRLNY
jgi:hypothetical protein